MARRVTGTMSAVSYVATGARGQAAFVRFEAEHVEVTGGRSGRGHGSRGLGQQVRMVVIMMVMVV